MKYIYQATVKQVNFTTVNIKAESEQEVEEWLHWQEGEVIATDYGDIEILSIRLCYEATDHDQAHTEIESKPGK